MGRGTTYHVAGCHRIYVDTPRTGSPVGSAEFGHWPVADSHVWSRLGSLRFSPAAPPTPGLAIRERYRRHSMTPRQPG